MPKKIIKDDSSLRSMRSEIAAARKGKTASKQSRSILELAKIWKKRQTEN